MIPYDNPVTMATFYNTTVNFTPAVGTHVVLYHWKYVSAISNKWWV